MNPVVMGRRLMTLKPSNIVTSMKTKTHLQLMTSVRSGKNAFRIMLKYPLTMRRLPVMKNLQMSQIMKPRVSVQMLIALLMPALGLKATTLTIF